MSATEASTVAVAVTEEIITATVERKSTVAPEATETLEPTPTPEPEIQYPIEIPATYDGEGEFKYNGDATKEVSYILEIINNTNETINYHAIQWDGTEYDGFAISPNQSVSLSMLTSGIVYRFKDSGGKAIAEFVTTDAPFQIYEIMEDKKVFYYLYETPEQTEEYGNAELCQLVKKEQLSYEDLFFPRNPDRLPPTGEVNVIVLFADYLDVPAEMTPEEAFALVSPTTEEFYSAVSYGRMDLQLQPHMSWIRMSQSSAEYALTANRLYMLDEAISIADADVDFSEADAVLLISNPQADRLETGQVWLGIDDEEAFTPRADENDILNGIVTGADLTAAGDLWLARSLGFSLGLVDLHSDDDTGRYTIGEYSLMNALDVEAPEFTAYERWLLGWLDDDQIVCRVTEDGVRNMDDETYLAFGEEFVTTLSPLESEGGIKAVIIKNSSGYSNSNVHIIENRQALGYDSELTEPGIILYFIGRHRKSGAGPLILYNPFDPRVQPAASVKNLSYYGAFYVLEENDDGSFLVRINRAQE